MIVFMNDDIFCDEDSTVSFIEDGTITAFTQTATDTTYEVDFQYEDGYWWRETFRRPDGNSMESSFINSGGESNTELYTRAE